MDSAVDTLQLAQKRLTRFQGPAFILLKVLKLSFAQALKKSPAVFVWNVTEEELGTPAARTFLQVQVTNLENCCLWLDTWHLQNGDAE